MITLAESQKIWINDYNEKYKTVNTANEQLEAAKDFLQKRTRLCQGSGTPVAPSLLDVGCGIGMWSLALSQWYDVTGVDNSEVAINQARLITNGYYHRNTLNFICDDVRNLAGKYDVLFCRCPEFFSGYPTESEVFQDYLTAILPMAKKKFVLILHSDPPFCRNITTNPNQEFTSYMHDPGKIHIMLMLHGNTKTEYGEDSKIVSELIIEGN
ncbi:MAG: methyltransferase domain-containing protein [Candidatus Omnitrophica bacterium]|nr:methyltransferase domain-containing protein [Candidatus Omnitrophota bacterium]